MVTWVHNYIQKLKVYPGDKNIWRFNNEYFENEIHVNQEILVECPRNIALTFHYNSLLCSIYQKDHILMFITTMTTQNTSVVVKYECQFGR